jgi:CRP-like cAMP-binding protein
VAPFADLERGELAAITKAVGEARFAQGDWIVRRGQEEVDLHVITEGEIGIVIDGVEVATLPRGSFFGEISALLGEPAVADVQARGPVHCVVIPRAEVEPFLLENPRVTLRLLQAEARRLRTVDESRQ